jgi:MYXO-CTERM domain-containing protein
MKRLGLSLGVVAGVLLVGGVAAAQNGPTDPYGGMEGRIFDAGGGFKMPYRLGKPPGYVAGGTTKYPLVIFLCGSGEAGTDNRLQISKNIGTNTPGSVFTTATNQAKFPTFFIAPQTPNKDSAWLSGTPQVAAVLKLITAMEAEFTIDPKRLYLTGLSIGGRGTWMMLRENPNLFAAGIPMSGEDDPTMAAKIAKIPIWAFHGAMDTAINVKGSRDMIAAIIAAGGHPLYTEYPNGQHDIWFQAYNAPNLLSWMNSQVLGMEDNSTDAGVPLPRDAGAGGGTDAKPDAGSAAGTGGAAGASGAAGTTGSAGMTGGAAGMNGAAGVGAAGVGAAGAAGPSGAAGNNGTSGGAGNGNTSGAAGVGAAGAGTSGAAGTSGVSRGGSGGGCTLADRAAPSTGGVALAAIALLLAVRRRRHG